MINTEVPGGRGEPDLDETDAGERTALLVNATTSVLEKRGSNWSPHAFSVFRSVGAALGFKDVAVVRKPFLQCLQKRKLIVQSACGYFEAGKLHGIVDLEEEVAAKALLHVLAGATIPDSGTVTANGVPVASTVFRRVVGFISDKNVAILSFTAHANVMFALRMRQGVTAADAQALASAALAAVELRGDAKAKSMSPEELFRLNIAMELVIDPPVIFSAFPVETLEAHSLGQCIHCLQRICRRMGKTVVMALKGLPLQVVEQLDSVLLLGLDGQTVFSGAASKMLPYFSNLGLSAEALTCLSPTRNSPTGGRRRLNNSLLSPQQQQREGSGALSDASSMKTVISVGRGVTTDHADDDADDDDLLPIDSGDVVVDVVHLWAESTATTMKYAAAFYDSDERRAVFDAVDSQDREPNFLSFAGHNSPPLLEKIGRLVWYHTLQSLLQPDFYVLWVLLFTLLGLATWMMSSQSEDQRGMQNIRGVIFFIFSVVVQGNGELIHLYVEEVQTFVLHRDGGFYGSVMNSLVLALRLLTSRGVYLATFAAFVYAVLGNRSELVSLIAATSIAHAAVVYFIALCAPSKRVASYICHLVLVYSVIFSGFLINIASVPVAISKLSVIYYGYSAAVAHMLQDKTYSCDSAGNTTASYCYTGNAYIALQGFEDDGTDTNLKQLATVAVLFFVACCARMYFVKSF